MTDSSSKIARPVLVGLGMMLVAFNMRPALTTVGPLLEAIRKDTGLTASGAAFLTTLPVLCLGLACVLGPVIVRRTGAERGVLIAILIIAFGSGLRGLGGLPPLFAGACIAAGGIGLAGVMLPGLVKRDFSENAGLMTGLYTMVLCLGAATGAGAAVPLADALSGWTWALASWAVPAVVAALAWIALVPKQENGPPPPRRSSLWRDPLAWQVTGFMGLQSSLAYITFGWLPVVLQSRGLSAVEAGFVASVMSIGQAPSALLVPAFAARLSDQRGIAIALLALAAASFLALVHGPVGLVLPLGIGLGLGLGGLFGLALTIVVLRSRDVTSAAGLSAMSQAVGYSIAALGPLGFGFAHDVFGGWSVSAGLFCAIALASGVFALGAGRDRKVGTSLTA
ncbi:MFS transporter [Methylobacterium marchantiae]|uniref:MFS transporter n=1 Tax=Methylobacterium marchantiae TaxID=600331 RepID=A0ABW3WTH1_9HYPH|nr:putative transporter YycB [Methylobacterium marchantiae]